MAAEPHADIGPGSPDAKPVSAAPDSPVPEQPAEEVRPSERLVSLDAFRGLTVFLMLLVNNIALDAATPSQLTHAPWKGGIRLADLVLPWFLFCVGVAIPFSAASARRKGLRPWQYDLRVVKRTVLLVLLGCLLDSSLVKRPIFDLGVLQSIGLAYLAAALLYDLTLSRRVLVAGILLAGYWAAIRYVPVPGVGAGVFDESNNLISYLNKTHLMPLGLDGLTSVVPTAALAILGSVIGDILRDEKRQFTKRMAAMLTAGVGLVAGGLLWGLSLQFSKDLWTPSFVLVTAGTGTIALALLYLVIDGARWRWWAYPLVVFGANAIVGYVLPILAKALILQVWQIDPGGLGAEDAAAVLPGLLRQPGRPRARGMDLHAGLHCGVVAVPPVPLPEEDLPAGVRRRAARLRRLEGHLCFNGAEPVPLGPAGPGSASFSPSFVTAPRRQLLLRRRRAAAR